jgi:hypothetical protein
MHGICNTSNYVVVLKLSAEPSIPWSLHYCRQPSSTHSKHTVDIFHTKHSVQCSNLAGVPTLIPVLPPCCKTGSVSAFKHIIPLYKTYEVYGTKTTAKARNHHFKSIGFTIINWKCFKQEQHATLWSIWNYN